MPLVSVCTGFFYTDGLDKSCGLVMRDDRGGLTRLLLIEAVGFAVITCCGFTTDDPTAFEVGFAATEDTKCYLESISFAS